LKNWPITVLRWCVAWIATPRLIPLASDRNPLGRGGPDYSNNKQNTGPDQGIKTKVDRYRAVDVQGPSCHRDRQDLPNGLRRAFAMPVAGFWIFTVGIRRMKNAAYALIIVSHRILTRERLGNHVVVQ